MRAKLGSGIIDSLGDGGERIEWLCYDLPGARLWLTEELSEISEVTMMKRSKAAPVSSHCPALPAKFHSVKVDGYLTLGTSRADLIQRLGQPARQAGDWLTFHRTSSTKGDEYNELVIRLDNGKVAALWAKRLTTY
ncbi:hypothetical protein ABAC402_09795 [Asticcacaulis sp. AC402]|nr:hypothetical protein ABAC402_09795 [Asticcacaulis sp. AC402]